MPTPIRILLIEDNVDDVTIIQETLEGERTARFEVLCVGCLADGLARLVQGGVDLVLLDLTLPDSDGLPTLEQVRDSVSGFAGFKEDAAVEMAQLSQEIENIESERDALQSKIQGITEEAEANNSILTAQIDELNRIVDYYKDEMRILKISIEDRENQNIVIEAAKLHYNLGNFYFRNQKYGEAALEYERSILYRPNDPDAHHNLAVVYDEHLGHREKAILHYKRYLALNPSDESALEIENRVLDLEVKRRTLLGNTLAQR